jgi:acyl dehydratase
MAEQADQRGTGSAETSRVVPAQSLGLGRRTMARTYELSPRRIMAYAASINDANPVYFDDLREGGLVGHPCMAFSLQWNSRLMPDFPADPSIAVLGVHSGTDLRLLKPFEEGAVVTSQGQIILVEQIRPGIRSVTRYRMVDSMGELVAELDMAGILRGCVLDGPGGAIAEEQALPQKTTAEEKPVWSSSVSIVPEAAQVYTECAEIYNPIHTERRVARAAGLPDIILQGSAIKAIALREIVDRCLDGDPTQVRRLAGQLRAMVLMNTTIEVRCLEERSGPDGSREIFFDVLNAEGRPAVANGVVVSGPA